MPSCSRIQETDFTYYVCALVSCPDPRNASAYALASIVSSYRVRLRVIPSMQCDTYTLRESIMRRSQGA